MRSAAESLDGLCGVLRGAHVGHLATFKPKVVVKVHVNLSACSREPHAVADERVNLIIVGRKAQWRELEHLTDAGDVLEVARDTVLPGAWAIPRRRGAGSVNRPVDVICDL